MSWFRQPRDIELSLIDYIRTQINASWAGITVVKTFKQATKATLPVICVRLLDTTSSRREIGANTLNNNYGIIIDILATSDGLRLDLTDFLIDILKDGCIYYEFSQSSSNPEELDKTADGRIRVVSWVQNTRIDFGEGDVGERDRFRQLISIIVAKS